MMKQKQIDIFMQKSLQCTGRALQLPNFLKRIITMHEPTERATESQESVLSNPNNGLHLRPDDAPPSSDDNPHLQSTGTAPSSNGSPHLQPNSAAATSSSVYLQANGTLERSPETPTAVVSSRFRVPVFSDNPLTEPRIHVLSNVTAPRTSLLKTLKDIGSVFTLQISGEVAQNATTTIRFAANTGHLSNCSIRTLNVGIIESKTTLLAHQAIVILFFHVSINTVCVADLSLFCRRKLRYHPFSYPSL